MSVNSWGAFPFTRPHSRGLRARRGRPLAELPTRLGGWYELWWRQCEA